jgi:hypothetical protein
MILPPSGGVPSAKTRTQSPELSAVLHIFNHDAELRTKTLPYVNVEREAINWPGVWGNDFSGGHAAAVVFAQALWADRVETRSDPFDCAFAMDHALQLTCIQALAIRWGLKGN